MTWVTLEQGKTRLGIDCTDPTKDSAVQLALDYATARVEKYCERKFEEQQLTQSFFPPEYVLYMDNWPVVSVDDILFDDVSQAGLTYKVDKSRGVIYFDTSLTSFADVDEVKVVYTAGFNPVPDDITNVILDVAAARYATKDEDITKGPVKFERIDGFVSTSYGDPSVSTEYGVLAPYIAVLDSYRSERTQGSWL